MKNIRFFANIINLLKQKSQHILHSLSDPGLALFIICVILVSLFYFSGIFVLVPKFVDTLLPFKMRHFFTEVIDRNFLTLHLAWLSAIKGLIFVVILWTIFKIIQSRFHH